jgi:hypothetical protein
MWPIPAYRELTSIQIIGRGVRTTHPRIQGAYFDDDSDGIEDSGSSPRAGNLLLTRRDARK